LIDDSNPNKNEGYDVATFVEVRTNEPADHPHKKGEPSPTGVVHDGWCGKLIPHVASLKLPTASRKDVLHPFALPTVRERNEESLRRSQNIHWCPLDPA
jgi:hypothetical protein